MVHREQRLMFKSKLLAVDVVTRRRGGIGYGWQMQCLNLLAGCQSH